MEWDIQVQEWLLLLYIYFGYLLSKMNISSHIGLVHTVRDGDCDKTVSHMISHRYSCNPVAVVPYEHTPDRERREQCKPLFVSIEIAPCEQSHREQCNQLFTSIAVAVVVAPCERAFYPNDQSHCNWTRYNYPMDSIYTPRLVILISCDHHLLFISKISSSNIKEIILQ